MATRAPAAPRGRHSAARGQVPDQPRTPLLGELDERESATWDTYLDLVRDHGVDTFIFDWYWYDGRPALHEALDSGYLNATNREGVGFAATDALTAEQIYQRGWALALLDQVLTRLRDEYSAAGPASAGLFDQLQKLLTDESDRPSQAEIACELGMTENAVKQAYHRLRQRYRELLREEIAHTVMLPGDIEDELRHLISVLRA